MKHKYWLNTYSDEPEIVIKTTCYETQIVMKDRLLWNTDCDETQIVTQIIKKVCSTKLVNTFYLNIYLETFLKEEEKITKRLDD